MVAMATYSSHRLIIRKVEVDSNCFLLCQLGYFDFSSSKMCPLSFRRLLSKSLNLIGFKGDKNVLFKKKNSQKSSSQKP